ncbi:hypothetical protein IEE_01219 [Bacillus cereus BAG5X1-1]|uniref:Uncharacterized protein n=1 Tax=Bacillus cereus BAG5X1-1 TaxID=1053189 RepID=J8B7H8_BACCE|nr:hypothetical protein IEE_01219 [Bacillus cereus BAG5X1-1]
MRLGGVTNNQATSFKRYDVAKKLSFVLPISFWLAYKKTIFITLFILIVPIAICSMFFQINLEQIQLYNSVLFVSSICMFIVSIFVSVKLYEKREF